MQRDVLRLGLLSTARINRQILAAAGASRRVEVVAVASRDAGRADDYARSEGIPRAHGSYEALLADGGVDAVYVPLPNALHHEWTMRSLAAGKHVLVEKPYSRHPGEVEEAFAAAERGGLVLMEAFMYRHHPQTAVAQMIARGTLGRLHAIRATFTFRLENAEDVRLDPALDGGALMDVGCYCVSGSRLFAGEPERVQAEQVVGESGVDVGFQGVLRFPGDVVAQIDASFLRPRFQRLEVFGEDAALTIEAPWRPDWGGRLLVQREGGVLPVETPSANPFECELVNFADAVAGDAPPLLGRDDALGQARAIEALYRAAEIAAAVAL